MKKASVIALTLLIALLLSSCSTTVPNMHGKEVNRITILGSAREYDIDYRMYYGFDDGTYAYSPSFYPEKKVAKTYPIQIEFVGNYVNCSIPTYNSETASIDYTYLIVSGENIVIYYNP